MGIIVLTMQENASDYNMRAADDARGRAELFEREGNANSIAFWRQVESNNLRLFIKGLAVAGVLGSFLASLASQ